MNQFMHSIIIITKIRRGRYIVLCHIRCNCRLRCRYLVLHYLHNTARLHSFIFLNNNFLFITKTDIHFLHQNFNFKFELPTFQIPIDILNPIWNKSSTYYLEKRQTKERCNKQHRNVLNFKRPANAIKSIFTPYKRSATYNDLLLESTTQKTPHNTLAEYTILAST